VGKTLAVGKAPPVTAGMRVLGEKQ